MKNVLFILGCAALVLAVAMKEVTMADVLRAWGSKIGIMATGGAIFGFGTFAVLLVKGSR